MALITLSDCCLQTPTCFFLPNLSAIDICCISVIVPSSLANFLSSSQRMPIPGCTLLMDLFIALGGAECLLLAVMAHDGSVALCTPQRHTLTIARALCLQVRALACVRGFALSLTLTMLMLLLPLCRSQEISHFYCDIPAVPCLACSDTRAKEIAAFLLCMIPPRRFPPC